MTEKCEACVPPGEKEEQERKEAKKQAKKEKEQADKEKKAELKAVKKAEKVAKEVLKKAAKKEEEEVVVTWEDLTGKDKDSMYRGTQTETVGGLRCMAW